MNKIWTFVIGKEATEKEVAELENKGKEFVSSWTAHDNPLDASFEIVSRRLVLVRVDEKAYAASGCSIDKLTRFIRQAGQEMGADLLDRQLVAYERQDGTVDVVHSKQLASLLADGAVGPETMVFDNTISDEHQLAQWKKPLRQTWLNRYLQRS